MVDLTVDPSRFEKDPHHERPMGRAYLNSRRDMPEDQLFEFAEYRAQDAERTGYSNYSYWRSVFRVFFRKKINIVILCVLAVVLGFTYIYPALIDYDPFANLMDSSAKHLLPAAAFAKYGASIHYILGTGASGEPIFDAVWNGARISLSLALVCGAINMTIGVLLGAIWGFSKKVDIIMVEVYNIIGNVPYVLIISVLILILTASFWTMVFALTITGWLFIAYFIRTQVIIIRDREYNLASRCLGTPVLRLTMRNILPFMTSVIVTLAATEIPSYISYEVFLSYIGIGLTDMSLGKIIQETQAYMSVPEWGFEYWSPVIVASIITIILYVVGQNLGDASDPKTHM